MNPVPQARDLGRPIRVVVFGGVFFEPYALEFLARLEEHPEIELAAVVCQSPGFRLHHRVRDVIRRRGVAAPPVLALSLLQHVVSLIRSPGHTLRLRRRVGAILESALTVPRIHGQTVLEHVRSLAPDLGLSYGSPILKPELFEIPRFGTLGIHQGKVPEYRGKKTTFWAVYNGEPTAGVTIQKINAGLDTGEIVRAGEISTGGKRYGQVDAEVQRLGIELYVDAILAVKRGVAAFEPQPPGHSPLYRQPRPRDVLRLWGWQLVRSGMAPGARPRAQGARL